MVPKNIIKFLRDEHVWAVYLGYDELTCNLTLDEAITLSYKYKGEKGSIFLQVEHPEELLNEQTKGREGQ